MAHTFCSHRIKPRGQDDPNTSAGPIIGGIFGVTIGAFILALVCICCLRGINSSRPRPRTRRTTNSSIIHTSTVTARSSPPRLPSLQAPSQAASPRGYRAQSSHRRDTFWTAPTHHPPVHHGHGSQAHTPHPPAQQAPDPHHNPSLQRSRTNAAPPPHIPSPQRPQTNATSPPPPPQPIPHRIIPVTRVQNRPSTKDIEECKHSVTDYWVEIIEKTTGGNLLENSTLENGTSTKAEVWLLTWKSKSGQYSADL